MKLVGGIDFQRVVMKDAEWCNTIGFSDFGGLNRIIRSGRAAQLVNLCEARHENRCSRVATEICNEGGVKLVMLSGPSSSGKTSTSLRISQQLRVHGLTPRAIELDNYFVDREFTPRLPSGEYDYECLEAMDCKLLQQNIIDLLEGRTVEIPRYDFRDGRKYFEGNFMTLKPGDILVLEGIHALNPAMTPDLPEDLMYRVYVTDVSSISNYDDRMHTTDNRLLRRICRDNRTRGIKPAETILRWPSVRSGEEKYIFPFQKNADAVFNSTLQYELPLLKHYVTPLLKDIPDDSPAFGEAQRLLNVLSQIDALPVDAINAIPVTSIIREFIGGQILFRD